MAYFLIVESRPLVVEITTKLLSFRGHQCEFVSSNEEALARLPLHRPDVIKTDQMEPGPPGLVLCELLKSQRSNCLISILIWSELSAPLSPADWFRAGANAHLFEPCSVDEFDTAIRQALSWPRSVEARRGAGQILFDTRDECGRLKQTNDLAVDALTLTSLPEEEVGVLKLAVLGMGDRLQGWGSVNGCESVASLRWNVERDRISLKVRRDRLPQGCPDDPLGTSVATLVGQCGFIAAPGSQTVGAIVLEKIIRA